MEKILVRRAEEADLDALRQHERLPNEKLADAHFALQAAGEGVYAVAWAHDQPLGTAVLDLRESEMQPQMRNMWVYPSARRMGAGRALSTFLEEAARAAGFAEVFLAVDPNNEKAIPLYVSLGYSPTGDHVFVENPEESQVSDPSLVSAYYAIYRKSLKAS